MTGPQEQAAQSSDTFDSPETLDSLLAGWHEAPEPGPRPCLIGAARGDPRERSERSDRTEVPYRAVAGSDGRWHLITTDPRTAARVAWCSHPQRPGRPRTVLDPNAPARVALHIPRTLRCGFRWGGDWPDFHAPERSTAPARWPGTNPAPPAWYVWAHLYPLQGFRCAACGVRAPHVMDHDHGTGLIRGLLCRTCNAMEAQCACRPHCFERYYRRPPAGRFHWRYT